MPRVRHKKDADETPVLEDLVDTEDMTVDVGEGGRLLVLLVVSNPPPSAVLRASELFESLAVRILLISFVIAYDSSFLIILFQFSERCTGSRR